MEHGRLLPGYPDGGSIRPVIIGNKRHDRPALRKTIWVLPNPKLSVIPNNSLWFDRSVF